MVTVTKKAPARKPVAKKLAARKPVAKKKVRAKVAATAPKKPTTTTRKKVVGKKVANNRTANDARARKAIETQINALVDDYGAELAVLDSRLKRLKPLRNRVAEKEAAILTLIDSYLPVAATGEYAGDVWGIEVGAKGVKSSIKNVVKLYNYLETLREGLGDELMTFGISDIKKYLNPEEQKKMIKETREGKRSIKLEPK